MNIGIRSPAAGCWYSSRMRSALVDPRCRSGRTCRTRPCRSPAARSRATPARAARRCVTALVALNCARRTTSSPGIAPCTSAAVAPHRRCQGRTSGVSRNQGTAVRVSRTRAIVLACSGPSLVPSTGSSHLSRADWRVEADWGRLLCSLLEPPHESCLHVGVERLVDEGGERPLSRLHAARSRTMRRVDLSSIGAGRTRRCRPAGSCSARRASGEGRRPPPASPSACRPCPGSCASGRRQPRVCHSGWISWTSGMPDRSSRSTQLWV